MHSFSNQGTLDVIHCIHQKNFKCNFSVVLINSFIYPYSVFFISGDCENEFTMILVSLSVASLILLS